MLLRHFNILLNIRKRVGARKWHMQFQFTSNSQKSNFFLKNPCFSIHNHNIDNIYIEMQSKFQLQKCRREKKNVNIEDDDILFQKPNIIQSERKIEPCFFSFDFLKQERTWSDKKNNNKINNCISEKISCGGMRKF